MGTNKKSEKHNMFSIFLLYRSSAIIQLAKLDIASIQDI